MATSAVNATTMWMPGTGYLAAPGQATPEEQQQNLAYQYGVNINYPGGSSPANPAQWATPQTAQQVATNLGGSVQNQQLEGPGYNYSSPQPQIAVPGAPSTLNAGLVQGQYDRYGSDPYGIGSYQVNRDLSSNQGNYPSYALWASSQPGFQMNSQMANSGPGYNFVADPKNPGQFINLSNPSQGSLTQQQAIDTIRNTAVQQSNQQYSRPSSYQPYTGVSPNLSQTQQTQQQPTDNSASIARREAAYKAAGIPTDGKGNAIPGYSQAQINQNLGEGVDYGLLNPGLQPTSPYAPWGFGNTDPAGDARRKAAMEEAGYTQNQDGSWTAPDGTTIPAQTGDSGGQWGVPPGEAGSGDGVNTQPGGGGGGSVAPNQNWVYGGGQGFPSSVSNNAYIPNSQFPGSSPLRNGSQYFASDPYGPGAPGQAGPVNPIYNQAQTPEGVNEGEGLQYKTENDRAMAIAQGLSLQGDLGNYVNYQQGRASDYENLANSAYYGIASGQGGYSDAEKNAILQEPYLQGLQLTDEERSGISGDPWGPYRQLGLDEQSIDNSTWSRNNAVRGALGQQEGALNQNLGVTRGNLAGEIQGQKSVMRGDLSDIAALTRQYVNPTELNTSREYMQNYQVTPRDQQNILDEAGRTVMNQERMDEERLMQQANAQGNTSPLALQAARERMRQSGAVNEANAMSDAAIAAKQLQLNTTQGRENTRLGAAQNYANLGTSNEQYMGRETLGTETTLGAAEQGAEQYLGNQAQQAQMYLGNSRVSNEQQLGQAGTQAEEFKTATNLGAGQQAEATTSQRAGQIAGNRQQTGQFIYGQNAAANTNFANQRMANEQEYRGYVTGQGNQANQAVTIGNQQRIGAYGTQLGAQNTASGNAIVNYKTPGAIEKVFSGGGAKGGVTKGPEMALVGEAGPELIIDLAKIPHEEDGDVFDPGGSDSGMDFDPDMEEGPGGFGSSGGPSFQSQNPYTGTQAPENPLYKQIVTGLGKGNRIRGGGGVGGSKGGVNLIGKALKVASLFLAKGGVVGTHHPYGKRGESIARREMQGAGMSLPKVELVTHPQIRTLGAKVPQAVLPLTQRKGNKVTPQMLPGLLKKYGGYGQEAGI